MIAHSPHRKPMPRQRTFAAMALFSLVCVASLGGCAGLGDGPVSSAFVDPAKYDYYDCKLLETERQKLAKRAAELEGLMAKADSGVAGPVVAEIAYRNDLISARAQAKLADEAWRRNKCHDSPPDATPAMVAPTPPVQGKGSGKGSHSRASAAVY